MAIMMVVELEFAWFNSCFSFGLLLVSSSIAASSLTMMLVGVLDLWQIVGIVSKASALETNEKQFLFVGPHSASLTPVQRKEDKRRKHKTKQTHN